MNEQSSRSNCSVAECFPEKPGVKHKAFEQSQGLDVAIYKSVPLPFLCTRHFYVRDISPVFCV